MHFVISQYIYRERFILCYVDVFQTNIKYHQHVTCLLTFLKKLNKCTDTDCIDATLVMEKLDKRLSKKQKMLTVRQWYIQVLPAVVREHGTETIYDPLKYSKWLWKLNWTRGCRGRWSSNWLTGCSGCVNGVVCVYCHVCLRSGRMLLNSICGVWECVLLENRLQVG